MPSVTVKEGYLHKYKTEGPQLLSRFAFKKRYFWLTSETLSYAKTPDWQVGTKPVDFILFRLELQGSYTVWNLILVILRSEKEIKKRKERVEKYFLYISLLADSSAP